MQGIGLKARWSQVQLQSATTNTGRANHLSISLNHPDQLSILSSAGGKQVPEKMWQCYLSCW